MAELHIEGMGLIGSMLARRLHEEGITFTWSENDTPFTAWHVSTGLAYPDGDPDNQAGLERWRTILMGDLAYEAAEAPYVFAHKSPPHSGRYPVTDYGKLRMAEPTAIALNVPEFVENTRTAFAAERLPETLDGATNVVVCHTTPERGDGYLWGWVARVRFELPEEIALDCLGQQPALYAKKHRFNLTYAYPIPGTGQWWAGSVLQMQREPKLVENRRLAELYRGWVADAMELLGVYDIQLDGLDQGWRPRSKKTDSGRVEFKDGRWTMPPMPTDGMRRGWLVVDDFIDRYQMAGALL